MADYQPSLEALGMGESSSQENYQPSLEALTVSPNANSNQQISHPSSATNTALSFLKSILPTPSMPLGLNVSMGALASPMPYAQRNLVEAFPQIMAGENYGISNKVASRIGETIPSIMAGGPNLYTQALTGFGMGAAQAPQGQKLQSGEQNALNAITMGHIIPALGKGVGNLFMGASPKDIATGAQSVVNQIENEASSGFDQVRKGVYNNGISQIPISSSVKNDILSLIDNKIFPNTKYSKDLMNNSLNGDFNSLRDLQSELWRKGTKGASSPSILENNKGEEIFDLRDRINDAISNHLLNTGNEDLNNILNESRASHKYLQDTFFNKDLPSQFKKMVNPRIQQTPSNIGNLMENDSKPMQSVKNALTSPRNPNWNGNAIYTYPTDISSYNFKKGIAPAIKNTALGALGINEILNLYELRNLNRAHQS